MTPAASSLQFELDERLRWFGNSWFPKWHHIGEHEVAVIDVFDGSTATLGGIVFSGTVRQVYWDSIVRGARGEVEERLRWIDAEVRRYSPDGSERTVDECVGLLISFVERIQAAAVEKFRVLCGDGERFPPRVDLGRWEGLSRAEIALRGEELKRALPQEEDQLAALVRRPSESIAVELKTWIDPRTPEGAAKIAKAAFAMRNRNGGFLVIGFDDKSGEPDRYGLDGSPTELFHVDIVQQIISRYASDPFPVEVAMKRRNEQMHPVVVVPSGIRVPVVVKSPMNGGGGKPLMREGDLYFRTLRSNGSPSSALIRPGDWPDLMELCFNNREGDIGGFVRRQLGGADRGALAAIFRELAATEPHDIQDPESRIRERAAEVIENGWASFDAAIAAREKSDAEAAAIAGLAMHVGLALDPPKMDELPTRGFLDVLAGANPQYTGWPIWLDARSVYHAEDRPVVKNGAWEALSVRLVDEHPPHLEFMRLDPRGAFYLRRAMQDDLNEKVKPGTALDTFLMLTRSRSGSARPATTRPWPGRSRLVSETAC